MNEVASILTAGDRKAALGILLNRDESPGVQGDRFAGHSPITYAFALADKERLPYGVLQHGPRIRVYPTKVGAGAGKRGSTETFVEVHSSLLPDEDPALLWLRCSADALADVGSLEELLLASGRFAGGLAEGLRDRIYKNVVPTLGVEIVAARGLRELSVAGLPSSRQAGGSRASRRSGGGRAHCSS